MTQQRKVHEKIELTIYFERGFSRYCELLVIGQMLKIVIDNANNAEYKLNLKHILTRPLFANVLVFSNAKSDILTEMHNVTHCHNWCKISLGNFEMAGNYFHFLYSPTISTSV